MTLNHFLKLVRLALDDVTWTDRLTTRDAVASKNVESLDLHRGRVETPGVHVHSQRRLGSGLVTGPLRLDVARTCTATFCSQFDI